MTRILPHCALLVVLLGAWFVRAEVAPRRVLAGADRYAPLDDSESAYRLRAIELALAAGQAPRNDTFLGAGASPAVPFPPLVHAALALVASSAMRRDDGPRELAGVEEHALEDLTVRLSPVLGLLGVAVAFVTCWWLARGPRRTWGAIAAAALLAFSPTAIAGEAAGTLRAQPWIEVLSFAELAALVFALRAREQIDITIGGLLAGLFAGLSLLAGFEAWPLAVATLGVLIALAKREPRTRASDDWRSVMLFSAVTCSVVVLAEPGGSLEFALPQLSSAPALAQVAYAAAAFPLAWLALFERRRDPVHAILLAAGFLAFACALFDARFLAVLHVVFAATVAVLVADPAALRSRLSSLALPAVGLITLITALAPWGGSQPVDASVHREFVDGLHWLRANSASPGPFNSADAYQEWRVWTAPELAGSVAYYARRPLIAASIGVVRTPGASAPDRAASDLLQQIDAAGAVYVVVTPCMLRNATFEPSSDLPTLALDGAGAPPRSWERVYASTTRITPAARAPLAGEAAGPVLTIWRRNSPASSAGMSESRR